MTTSLIHIVGAFTDDEEAAEKATFCKAMEERINKDGYKMSDLMFEVFVCQKQICALKKALTASGLFYLDSDHHRTPKESDECNCLYEMAEDELNRRYEKEQIDKCALKQPSKKSKSAKDKGTSE